MEFTPSRIAGLVLGYLKLHQHTDAFNSFLEESKHFEKDRQSIKMGKCFITRVMGMCLEDFLEEYSKIYSIIQGRLEATSFYAEKRPKTSLYEELLYLLETDPTHSSSPIYSEVETTPAHALPGNSDEDASSMHETPVKKSSRSKTTRESFKSNSEKSDPLEMSGMLSQSMLEKPELYSKLADTINEVRNTPEVAKGNSDDIGAGASKELDAIIKTVVQRTEEDPLYNELLNEIIGANGESTDKQPSSSSSSHQSDESVNRSKRVTRSSAAHESIEEVNNDAIRSIIAVSQVTDPPSLPNSAPPPQESKNDGNNEIYVFDGPLDQYLKTSGSTSNSSVQNPLYISAPGLLVVPQYEESQNHFYLVNNQPLVNMTNVISNNDILAMPTVIVNDAVETAYSSSVVSDGDSTSHLTNSDKSKLENFEKNKTDISPVSGGGVSTQPIKATPPVNNKTKRKRIESKTTKAKANKQPPAAAAAKKKVATPKKTTHVRNLDHDFLSSAKSTLTSTTSSSSTAKSAVRAWDSDLRMLANCAISSPPENKKSHRTRSRTAKNNVNNDKKSTKQNETEVVDEEKECVEKEESESSKVPQNNSEEPPTQKELAENVEEEKSVVEAKKIVDHQSPPNVDGSLSKNVVDSLNTPLKAGIPKTPCFGTNLTPFTQVLEDQLRGVDVMSLPTPSFPITPGLNLTPCMDSISYNHRSTDYSTSSSYYVPSDTEQNKSIEQLVEECKKNKSPHKLKILSNVVIDENKLPPNENQKVNKEPERKIQRTIIAKKNLSLMKHQTSSSSSSDSDSSGSSDSENTDETSNKTVVLKDDKLQRDVINSIIGTVDIKSTLLEVSKKKLLEDLETTRRRTMQKLKMTTEKKNIGRSKVSPKPQTKSRKKAGAKKTKIEKDNKNANDEAQKLVTGLWQRGIHLVPNKSPNNKVAPPSPEKIVEEESDVVEFDKRTYESVEVATHKEGNVKKLEDYDFVRLEKAWTVNFYQEELDRVVSRTLKCSPFEILLDVSPKIMTRCRSKSFTKTPEKKQNTSLETMDCETDDLMNFAVAGNIGCESPGGKSPPKSSRKRKIRNSMDEKSAEKKPKKFEQNIKLLKKIDVELFLDKVHNV